MGATRHGGVQASESQDARIQNHNTKMQREQKGITHRHFCGQKLGYQSFPGNWLFVQFLEHQPFAAAVDAMHHEITFQ